MSLNSIKKIQVIFKNKKTFDGNFFRKLDFFSRVFETRNNSPLDST